MWRSAMPPDAREPKEDIAEEFLSDSFWPICSPQLLPPAGRLRNVAILRNMSLSIPIGRHQTSTHQPGNGGSSRPRKWRSLPDFKDMQHLSFREELHAIEAVVAGQGIGIFSNVLVASELASGALVKAFDLSLPGTASMSSAGMAIPARRSSGHSRHGYGRSNSSTCFSQNSLEGVRGSLPPYCPVACVQDLL